MQTTSKSKQAAKMAKTIWCMPFVAAWLLLASDVSARITTEHPKLARSETSDVVLGSYIVVMEEGATDGLESLPSFDKSYVKFQYKVILNQGYAVENVPDDVMESWLESSSVRTVYEDSTVARELSQSTGSTTDAVTTTSNSDTMERFISQVAPPWNLDRLDQRRLPLDAEYNSRFSGENVTIAIVDDGVLKTHDDFQEKYVGCFDFTKEGCEFPGEHGTNVASLAAGITYGIAKRARILDVKVFASTPTSVSSWSTVIAGFDLVAQLKLLDPDGKLVLNASFNGGFNQAMNEAAREVTDLGVLVIAAAGNADTNACSQSPAAEPSVITVASTDIMDVRSDFSNYGPCVDMFAPGSNVTVASVTSNNATDRKFGTDMAAPHVAGIAAILLEREVPNPQNVIVGLTTPGVVNDTFFTPNRMAFNGYIAAPTPPPTPFRCPSGQDVFRLELLTDTFPREISWILRETCTSKGVKRRSPNFYTELTTLYVEEFCITSDTAHTFTIYDTDGEGLIPPGKYEIYLNDNLVGAGGEANGNDYQDSQTIQFGPPCPAPPAASPAPAPTSAPTAAPVAAPTCILGFDFGGTFSDFAQRGRAFFGG